MDGENEDKWNHASMNWFQVLKELRDNRSNAKIQ